MADIHLAGELEFTGAEAVEAIRSYPSHATVAIYDCGGPDTAASPIDRVTLGDIGRLVVINAELHADDVPALLKLSGAFAACGIGPGADLADADPGELGGLYDRMGELWAAVTAHKGIGSTKASKLLHLKWPAAFPLLDRYVRSRYYVAASAVAERYPLRYSVRLYWASIRQDVIANRVALDAARAELRHGDDWAQTLAGLSDLRLIDLLVWSRRDIATRS